MITLGDLLLAREKRAEMQKRLVSSFSKPLVSFTVNMPGPVKKNENSLKIFDAGMLALREKLAPDVVYCKCSSEETGYEGVLVVDIDGLELKKKTCGIEDTHPLGRLFDIDVIDADMTHVKRADIGYPGRKCLICGEDAFICSRSRRHGVDELLTKIDELVDKWEKAK